MVEKPRPRALKYMPQIANGNCKMKKNNQINRTMEKKRVAVQ